MVGSINWCFISCFISWLANSLSTLVLEKTVHWCTHKKTKNGTGEAKVCAKTVDSGLDSRLTLKVYMSRSIFVMHRLE